MWYFLQTAKVYSNVNLDSELDFTGDWEVAITIFGLNFTEAMDL